MSSAFLSLLLCASTPANDVRVAIVVANNLGAEQDPQLHFAQTDARRVAQTLRELGGVQPENLHLMLEQRADDVRAAIKRLGAAQTSSAGATLIFYYSGHADAEALHLGPTRLPWTELRGLLRDERWGLRVALIDACQAGALTAQKGFALAPPVESREVDTSGTAVIVATESGQAAQESLSLGGSFFTHYLVSALRGAADADDDGLVTLSEARSYTTTHTTRATGTWAPQIQRPLFEFDLKGHHDVALTRISSGSALVELTADISGYAVVTERGAKAIVVEATKDAGRVIRFALPTGRYVLALRQPDAVYIAEFALVWGGSTTIRADDLERFSYQAVERKGDSIEIHHNTLRIGAAVQSALVDGTGIMPLARISYGFRIDRVELGLRAAVGRNAFDTVDSDVRTLSLGGGVFGGYEWPVWIIDIRTWIAGEVYHWRQEVRSSSPRRLWLLGAGIGVGARIPIWEFLFGELSAEVFLFEQPSFIGEAGIGARF